MVSSDPPNKPPRLSSKLHVSIPAIQFRGISNTYPIPASDSVCSAYEYYLRLPELRKLWNRKEFSDWKTESILKPALQALEITFRFVSTVLSDKRPYANRREWTRRIESLTTSQIELIASIIEDEAEDSTTRGTAPIADLSSTEGVLVRDGSYAEVWKVPGETTVVNKTSEASLLPRLATWQTSEDVAQKILYSIECEMRRCPYTLGLGEPNLNGKPTLEYDTVLQAERNPRHQKRVRTTYIKNQENQSVSRELVEITRSCKELKPKVPEVLVVEVDPKGGPRIQESSHDVAIEGAVKRFFYAYQHGTSFLVVAIGSLEAKGNGVLAFKRVQRVLFLEPTYFASMDAAKTFLGESWSHEQPNGVRETESEKAVKISGGWEYGGGNSGGVL
ncbi:nematode resistance protein-like HSPRO2 [Populus alba x Populus x berolinensis]|nr:nematode resistance protein-like HSPRO2 [Populus alba x Populus x berolinensis]